MVISARSQYHKNTYYKELAFFSQATPMTYNNI